MKLASIRAIELKEKTGACLGRWGCNYIYGTNHVLCGLDYHVSCSPRCSCQNSGNGSSDDNTPLLQTDCDLTYPTHLARCLIHPALTFLKTHQNPGGGWGETLETYRDPSLARIGRSTPSQTAWALMGLLSHLPPDDQGALNGWLGNRWDAGKGEESEKDTAHWCRVWTISLPNFCSLSLPLNPYSIRLSNFRVLGEEYEARFWSLLDKLIPFCCVNCVLRNQKLLTR